MGSLTRFGVFPNSRGKIGIWDFLISIESILIIGFFSSECEFYLLFPTLRLFASSFVDVSLR
jgi:hypothetical protein